MPSTNPDKMGPKCLETQIGDPDRSFRKYYSMSINPDKYQHESKNMDFTSKSSYLPLRLTKHTRLYNTSTTFRLSNKYPMQDSILILITHVYLLRFTDSESSAIAAAAVSKKHCWRLGSVFQYRDRGRAREFLLVTDATLLFQTKQYLLLLSIQFPCLLDTHFPSNQALPYIEVTDYHGYGTL